MAPKPEDAPWGAGGDMSPRKGLHKAMSEDGLDGWIVASNIGTGEGDLALGRTTEVRFVFINVAAPEPSVQTKQAQEKLEKLLRASQDLTRAQQTVLLRDFLTGLGRTRDSVDAAFLVSVEVLAALVDPNTAAAAELLKKTAATTSDVATFDTRAAAAASLSRSMSPAAHEEAVSRQLRSVVSVVFDMLSSAKHTASDDDMQSLDQEIARVHEVVKLGRVDAVKADVPVGVRHDAGIVLQMLSRRAFDDGCARIAGKLVEAAEALFVAALDVASELNATMPIDPTTRSSWQCLQGHLVRNTYFAVIYDVDMALAVDPTDAAATEPLKRASERLTHLSRSVHAHDQGLAQVVSMARLRLVSAQLRIQRHDPDVTQQALRYTRTAVSATRRTDDALDLSASVWQQAVALGEMLLAILQFGDVDTIEREWKDLKEPFCAYARCTTSGEPELLFFTDSPPLDVLARMCLRAFDAEALAYYDAAPPAPEARFLMHLWSAVARSVIGDMSGMDASLPIKTHLSLCDWSLLRATVNVNGPRWRAMAAALVRWLAPHRDTLLTEVRNALPLD